jgi:hypothetical protein
VPNCTEKATPIKTDSIETKLSYHKHGKVSNFTKNAFNLPLARPLENNTIDSYSIFFVDWFDERAASEHWSGRAFFVIKIDMRDTFLGENIPETRTLFNLIGSVRQCVDLDNILSISRSIQRRGAKCAVR